MLDYEFMMPITHQLQFSNLGELFWSLWKPTRHSLSSICYMPNSSKCNLPETSLTDETIMETPMNYNSWSAHGNNQTQSEYVQRVLMFALFYPAAIILNLLLVIIILVKKDLRDDHSKWTLMHASIAGLIFLINSFVYNVEKFQEDMHWLTSTSCHMSILVDGVVSHVAKFAILLVSADRVWAIWRPANFPQGFSKTVILASILIMWLLNIFIFPTIYYRVFERTPPSPEHYVTFCKKDLSTRNVSIYYVWPYLPIFLVILSDIIALAVFLKRKHDYINKDDVKAIATPTMIMDVFFMALYFPYMVMLFCFATENYVKVPDVTFYMLILIFWVIYPLLWLLSREIKRELCPCESGTRGERAKLISIENVQEFTVQDRPAQITIKLPPPADN